MMIHYIISEVEYLQTIGSPGEEPKAKVYCSESGHKAVDTGMTKSWCKNCDITMWFNKKTAEYEIVDPYEEKR